MSRGNLLLGQRVGKVGDSVYYRSKGEIHKRRYVAHPRDPKSFKQAQQRAKFAAVALAYNFFAVIIERSTRWRDRLTAYNDFQARNYTRAPYASKRERQQWEKFYCLPAIWSLASGPLTLPPMWSATPSVRTPDVWAALRFANSTTFYSNILKYALANGFLPSSANDGETATLTAEQIAEAMAQRAGTRVCLCWTEPTDSESEGETLNAQPLHLDELNADKFRGHETDFCFVFSAVVGWTMYTTISHSYPFADGQIIFPVGGSDNREPSTAVGFTLPYTLAGGFQFAVWTATNAGYAVQTSDVILQLIGDKMTETARDRCDLTNEITLAAVMTWQE